MSENMSIFAGVYETREQTKAGGWEHQHIHDATIWVLHVPTKNLVERELMALRLNELIARRVPVQIDGVIGYCGGDSWADWTSKAGEDEDTAMHIYFEAPAPIVAALVGSAIAGIIERRGDYNISTAGDWAEQLS